MRPSVPGGLPTGLVAGRSPSAGHAYRGARRSRPFHLFVLERRKGKTVTVITGLNPVAPNLDAILAQLKSACAAGGTINEGRVEIQGDHRERALSILRDLGYDS